MQAMHGMGLAKVARISRPVSRAPPITGPGLAYWERDMFYFLMLPGQVRDVEAVPKMCVCTNGTDYLCKQVFSSHNCGSTLRARYATYMRPASIGPILLGLVCRMSPSDPMVKPVTAVKTREISSGPGGGVHDVRPRSPDDDPGNRRVPGAMRFPGPLLPPFLCRRQ